MKKNTPIVPAQRTGIAKDFEEVLEFETEKAAAKAFQAARRRLLDVNRWDALVGELSRFTLRNAQGRRVKRRAKVGDHFQISIPGPGNQAGDGDDWVQVEVLEDREEANGEVTFLRVHPVSSPLNDDPNTAHFLHEKATNTFLVRRKGLTVSAEIHVRNELANTDSAGLLDKIRNAAVTLGAWLGLSDVQWKRLVAGLVGAK